MVQRIKDMKIFTIILIIIFITKVNSQHYQQEQEEFITKYIPGSDVLAKTKHKTYSRHNDGSYNYEYETSNGISAKQVSLNGKTVQGESQYLSPEGKQISLQYTADEFGYHPIGDHIPKIPDYILRSLEYIRTHPYKIADSSGNIKTVTFAPHAFHVLDEQKAIAAAKATTTTTTSNHYNNNYQHRQQYERPDQYQQQQQSRYQQQQEQQQIQQQRNRQKQQREQERRLQQQLQQKQQFYEEPIQQQQRYLRKREQEQFEQQKQYYQDQQFSPLFSRNGVRSSLREQSFRRFF